MEQTIVGRGSIVAKSEYDTHAVILREQYWTVDIYSDKWEMTEVERTIEFTEEIYPWRFRTIEEVLRQINFKVTAA